MFNNVLKNFKEFEELSKNQIKVEFVFRRSQNNLRGKSYLNLKHRSISLLYIKIPVPNPEGSSSLYLCINKTRRVYCRSIFLQQCMSV